MNVIIMSVLCAPKQRYETSHFCSHFWPFMGLLQIDRTPVTPDPPYSYKPESFYFWNRPEIKGVPSCVGNCRKKRSIIYGFGGVSS